MRNATSEKDLSVLHEHYAPPPTDLDAFRSLLPCWLVYRPTLPYHVYNCYTAKHVANILVFDYQQLRSQQTAIIISCTMSFDDKVGSKKDGAYFTLSAYDKLSKERYFRRITFDSYPRFSYVFNLYVSALELDILCARRGNVPQPSYPLTYSEN